MSRGRYGRPVRRIVTVAMLLFAAACSGSDDAIPPAPAASATTAIGSDARDAGATSASVADEGVADQGVADADERPEPIPATVTMSVASDAAVATITIDAADVDDPFGTFASCSGLRTSVGTYSVVVSTPSGTVRSIGLLTDDPIDGPGIHDAQVRVELAAGEPLVAIGTMTLAGDLSAGTFVTFTPDGQPIDGEFECTGGSGPEPLVTGTADGTAETIEVVALLRMGDAERVLGLAIDTRAVPTAACPGATGEPDDSVVVRVDGDGSIGALTTFELTGGGVPTMRLRAADAVYEFDTVDAQVEPDATSGTFSATGPAGLTVDGAFRCT